MCGPPAQALIEVVRSEDLKTEVLATLHRWGAALLTDPDGLNNGRRQPYVALSMTWMLHTLDSGAVHSKKVALDWAREQMDPRWTPLLERAWAKYADQFMRYQELADPVDLQLTWQFIRSALDAELLESAD